MSAEVRRYLDMQFHPVSAPYLLIVITNSVRFDGRGSVCFVFISSTMIFSRHGLGVFATHNHVIRNTRVFTSTVESDFVLA